MCSSCTPKALRWLPMPSGPQSRQRTSRSRRHWRRNHENDRFTSINRGWFDDERNDAGPSCYERPVERKNRDWSSAFDGSAAYFSKRYGSYAEDTVAYLGSCGGHRRRKPHLLSSRGGGSGKQPRRQRRAGGCPWRNSADSELAVLNAGKN